MRELLGGENVAVDDFERERGGGRAVAEVAEEDSAEVSGSEVADEFQVAEMEASVGGESCRGSDCCPVRILAAVVECRRGGGGGGGRCCGGGESVVEA